MSDPLEMVEGIEELEKLHDTLNIAVHQACRVYERADLPEWVRYMADSWGDVLAGCREGVALLLERCMEGKE